MNERLTEKLVLPILTYPCRALEVVLL